MSNRVNSQKITNFTAITAQKFMFNGEFVIEGDLTSISSKVLHAPCVANILIGNADLRMIFKIHFDYKNGEQLCRRYLRNDQISERKIDDFFLENCNLIAGKTKQFLIDNNLNVGISIPVLTRGFDELFFSFPLNDDSYLEWHWDLKNDDKLIHCSLFVEILGKIEIKDDDSFGESNEGEVEFL